jgi:flagellar brake protein
MPAVDEPLLTLDDDAHSPYALRAPREIAQVLRALVEARALISAALVPGGHSCPTALLAVHDDGSLILDGNRREAMNRRMAAASRLMCSTQMDLVPIRFRLHRPTRITHDGYPAFVVPWPDTLLRLQRREMYRLQVSPAAPVTVHIDDHGDAPDATLGGLRVLDISGGGVAVSVPDGDERRFSPHSRVSPCLLRLAEGEPLPVTLEVTHIARYEVRGMPHWRAGCRFIDLSPASEQRILQYIFQVERQRNARQRLGG